jgi:hypothetical protein
MSQSREAVVDLEAATDQLVDELCHRFTDLYGLLGIALAETGVAVEDIRAHATELAHRLNGPDATATAVSIARTLWSQPGTPVPRSWWATPLGALLTERASEGPTPAAATRRPQGRRDRALTGRR